MKTLDAFASILDVESIKLAHFKNIPWKKITKRVQSKSRVNLNIINIGWLKKLLVSNIKFMVPLAIQSWIEAKSREWANRRHHKAKSIGRWWNRFRSSNPIKQVD